MGKNYYYSMNLIFLEFKSGVIKYLICIFILFFIFQNKKEFSTYKILYLLMIHDKVMNWTGLVS